MRLDRNIYTYAALNERHCATTDICMGEAKFKQSSNKVDVSMDAIVEKCVFEEVLKIFGKKHLKSALDATFTKIISDLEQLFTVDAKRDSLKNVEAVRGLRGVMKMFGATALSRELNKIETDLQAHEVNFSADNIFQVFFILVLTQREFNRLIA